MAQHDHEPQPEAPDLGASVQLESSQHLAAPAGDVDGLDAGYVPPDRPYALDRDTVTAAGMRAGETLDERLAAETPESPVGDDDPGRAGRLTVAGEGAALEIPDAMDAEDVGIDGGAASAEEAAMHEVHEVPGVPEVPDELDGMDRVEGADLGSPVPLDAERPVGPQDEGGEAIPLDAERPVELDDDAAPS